MAESGELEIPGSTILNELCSSKGFGSTLRTEYVSICTVIDQISTSADKILCLLNHEWKSLNITANKCSKMSEQSHRALTLRSHRLLFFRLAH